MTISGQNQTVPRDILEEKVGRPLSPGDTFSTKTGVWEVISVRVDAKNIDLLVIERISPVT